MVEGEAAPGAAGLAVRAVGVPASDDPGVPDGEGAGGEVEVVAAGAGGFGAAYPGGGEHQPHRVEPLLAGLVEESAQLLGGPHQVGLAGRTRAASVTGLSLSRR